MKSAGWLIAGLAGLAFWAWRRSVAAVQPVLGPAQTGAALSTNFLDRVTRPEPVSPLVSGNEDPFAFPGGPAFPDATFMPETITTPRTTVLLSPSSAPPTATAAAPTCCTTPAGVAHVSMAVPTLPPHLEAVKRPTALPAHLNTTGVRFLREGRK